MLSGREFRFLRKELGITQLYLESVVARHTSLRKLLASLQEASEQAAPAKLVFEDRPRKGWVREAA